MHGNSVSPTAFPQLQRLRQIFPAAPALDVPQTVRQGLAPLLLSLPPGRRVGIAVGSRGITGLATLVQAVIEAVRTAGAEPFVIPAMGSHGGATAAGQLALLAEYGVTESRLAVPFHPAMEVLEVGQAADGTPVVSSVEAAAADGIVLLNRVKPHTDFGGRLGSGLLKMLVVGLGKHVGAATFHRAASRRGHETVLRESARVLLARLPVIAGVAVIENQRHETARIEVVPAAALEACEGRLCAEADRLMPRLPFPEIDLLIVDRMGKNISGTGLDPAVIGRTIHGYSLAEDQERRSPHVRRLFVRELTPESHGNAIGIGLADFTTSRLVRAMNRAVTVTNSLTALSLQGAKIPIHFETDREAITTALDTLALSAGQAPRIVRIADTLHVEMIAASPALVDETIRDRVALERLGEPADLDFDDAGNLVG